MVMHFDGTTIRCIAQVSDVSSHGIGLRYQGHAVYANAGCTVFLKNRWDELTQIEGRVVFCHHAGEQNQRVGVKFLVPVDVHAYLPSDRINVSADADPAA